MKSLKNTTLRYSINRVFPVQVNIHHPARVKVTETIFVFRSRGNHAQDLIALEDL